MKLIVLFIIVACLQVSAKVSAQTVTMSENNVPLTDVFDIIKNQSGYRFFWKGDDLTQYKVSVELKNAKLADAMDAILKDLPLNYTITEHTIVINQKEQSLFDKIKNKIRTLLPQGINVNGIVTNKQGEALGGATVVVKRTQMGTNTDVRGLYTLHDVQLNDTIIISFIGYKTLFLPVNKAGFFQSKMEEVSSPLDEVVIQGYGRTTQRTTTGNIGRITAKDIESQPVSNPLLALEGKIPGVVITPQSGAEDGPIKVEIRGRNSLNSAFTTDPLYIIDGVPLTVLDVVTPLSTSNSNTSISRGLDQTQLSYSGGQSPMYNINPQDIQSIEVLKDADATAIYGSRGANGVILITTKRGIAGTNLFDVNFTEGANFATRLQPLLNTQEYLAMRYEQFKNDGITPTSANAADLFLWDKNAYTDWQKYAYGGIGNRTNAQATLSGGNDQTTFRLSGGYTRSTDVTAVSGSNQRATFAFNVTNHSSNKRLITSLTANYSYSDVNQVNLSGVSSLPPNAPAAYDGNGNLNFLPYTQAGLSNPFAALLRPYNSTGTALTANLTVKYNILKGLNISSSLGYTSNQNYQARYTPIASQSPYSTVAPTGTTNFGNTHVNNVIFEPQISYNRLISKGTLDVLGGATYQSNTTEGLIINGTGYTSDAFLHSISAAPATTSTDNYGQYKYAGLFARLGYNWEGKYIINFNGRRDGSSRFGAGNQFGNFGSVGVAWIVSDEKWIKKALPSAISFIKLRSSYGITGSDNVSDYQYLAQWGSTVNGFKLTSYNGIASIAPTLQANPNFHWQVNKKLDAELTVELFQGLLNVDVDYYRNRCDNQLVSLVTPEFTGFTSVTANSPASVQNSGWEFTLNTNLVKGRSFSWRNSFNIAVNRNILLAYPDLAISPYRNQYQIGSSINNQYVLNFAGIDPLTGLYTYTDHNGDGKITTSTSVFPGTQNSDAYVAINREPDFTGGLTSVFNYKKLQLTLSFSFAKQQGVNPLLSQISSSLGNGIANIPLYVYQNRWQSPGQTDALYGRLSTGSAVVANVTSSNAGYGDASYLRFRTITLAYTLPSTILKRIGVRNLSVNISTNNIFVITAYKGLDPETIPFGGQPPFRTIVSGLTASF